MADAYPPQPKHFDNQMLNSFYPDGSLFQFDLPPRYVLDDWYSLEEGGIYDVPTQPKHDWAGGYNGWTNWVDKMQKDHRFANVSDFNARANIFNEVHDPWMFTEYLYQGTGFSSDLDDAQAQQSSVVQPPLVLPTKVNRTYQEDDGVTYLADTSYEFANDQVATVVPIQHQTLYTTERKWRSDVEPHKEYWESELVARSWVEVTPGGETNRSFTRMDVERRVVKFAAPRVNSGVSLYRQKVWSRATRWGQSQNVPERTLTTTGPKQYFQPDSVFTGRIVPKVTVQWGIPLYDNCTQGEPQQAVRYDSYGSTAGSNIILFPRNPTPSAASSPDQEFPYALVPATDKSGGNLIDMPRGNLEKVIWNDPDYSNNELVHRGCSFWKGQDGKAFCNYYREFQDQFLPSWTSSPVVYTDATVAVATFEVEPFYESQDEVDATIRYDNGDYFTLEGSPWSFRHNKTGGLVTSVDLVLTDDPGRIIHPVTMFADFAGDATANTRTTITPFKRRKNRPRPDAVQCGSWRGLGGQDPSDGADAVAGYDTRMRAAKKEPCPYYTPVGQRVLASYTVEASNGAEWANMQRGLPAGYKKGAGETAAGQTMMDMASVGGGLGVGGSVAMGLGLAYAASVLTPDPFTNGLATDDFERIQVTYEPEIIDIAGKQTYYATPDGKPRGKDPDGDIRVRAGTGFNAIDTKANAPYGGVDSVFFGMVNQINYRVMRNVQHCFNATKCNPIITKPGGNVGWRRGWYGGVDFTAHPLRLPGYPAGDGKDESGVIKHCFTGDGRCPYTRLDRRATEYNENYKVLLKEVLEPFRIGGVGAFEGKGLVEAFVDDAGRVVTLTQDDYDATPSAKQWQCVAVRPVDDAMPVIGHWGPHLSDADGNIYQAYFFYDRPSWDDFHRQSKVAAHIVQFDDTNQTCYTPYAAASTPAADAAKLTAMYGDPAKVPWLVVLDDNYEEPEANMIQATNGKPFGGGRHPEYKDHSKRYRQVMSLRGGIKDNTYATGITESNQYGGPSWNKLPLTSQTKTGYWIDADGDWILDGRKIDTEGNYVEPRPRMLNKPPDLGTRTPVDGTPGITIQNDDDPTFNRSGDWAATGAVYSNDTKAFLAHLATIWSDYLPADPNSDDPNAKVQIGVPSCNEDMLPRERFWYQCDTCGLDYPEEEVNFLESRAYADGTKLYPLPSGEHYDVNGSRMGCPRGDGGTLKFKGSYDHFMNAYARGEADVWGPPGTVVQHDAYFWKAPTLINRVHHDQVLRKLGPYNSGVGGGYSFATLNPGVDRLGALPATTARSYDPGIARQIVAPWARPSDTIAAARERLSDDLHLKDTDYAVVERAGYVRPAMIPPDQEGSFQLRLTDTLTFWRPVDGAKPLLVGLPISVAEPPPPSILNEDLVKSDPHNDPKPVRTDYPDDGVGEYAFNEALRRWLIGVVYGSLQHWSSSTYMHANLLAEQVAARGGDPVNARPMDPKTGAPLDVDERILGPYGKTEAGGLKLVTLKHLKRLRNRVGPMLAYELGRPNYKANGDYTDRRQADHLNRFQDAEREMPFATFGTIAPQVLAATQTGKDYFVEWDIGDVAGTKYRAYYPVGTTWWRTNQRVGQIKRSGGINRLHLDDPKDPTTYTGDVIQSTVTYFLHGAIPMDKEVVRALLVFEPNDAPSMDAIGCQGQYTGYRGAVGFDGSFVDGSMEYIGGEFCFWQHYHGYTTNHEKDMGVPGGFGGAAAKHHVEHPEELPLDDPSIPGPMTDGLSLVRPQAFDGLLMEYHPWTGTTLDDQFANQVDKIGNPFLDHTLGFFLSQPAGATGNQTWIKTWDWHGPIKFNVTEYQVWKDMSFATYDKLVDRFRVRYKASVNAIEAQQTGTYFASEFRNNYWARENQPIPNWIKLQGYDTSGRFDRRLAIEDKIVTDDQVVAQAGIVTGGGIEVGGGNGPGQSGTVAKVMNITDVVQRLYNDRVDRFYQVTLGHKYEELFDLAKSKTDTNLGLHDAFHQGVYDPEYFWNYRYMRVGHGMWLNDPWHHTALTNDAPATDAGEGDPIPQSQDDRDARVQDVTAWDDQGLPSSDAGHLKFHPLSLLSYSPAPFTESSLPGGQTPAPIDNPDGGYWRVIANDASVQSFTMDLRSTPYENERRPWRYKAPSVDSTNALCPNPSCYVHQQGWTVGQFLANASGTWGFGVVPSTSSEYCANCRSLLTGVAHTPGDGILTVFYDKAMEQDAVIDSVEVATVTPGFRDTYEHGFAVEYYNTTLAQWRNLFTVNWDQTTRRYTWREWGPTGWFVRSANTLPTIFKGFDGQNGSPRDPAGAVGGHFQAQAGSKVRMRVFEPAVVDRVEPAEPDRLACVPDVAAKTVTVDSLADPSDRYLDRPIFLRNPDTGEEVECAVTDVADKDGKKVLTIRGAFTAEHTRCAFRWVEYVSKCSRFRVYGYPYRKGEVVFTPPGYIQPIAMGRGLNEYRLTNWPTQISTATMLAGEGVPIDSVEGAHAGDLYYTVEKKTWTYRGKSYPYLKITGGRWYYDFQRNVIVLPAQYADPDDGSLKDVWDLNKDLYANAEAHFVTKTLPHSITVEYILGCGSSVDVACTAIGSGPSYQLDRECVCFILGESDDKVTSPGLTSDQLPQMGPSVRLANRNGERIDLRWQVYNHEPIVGGVASPGLVGDELRPGQWGHNGVMNLLTGNHGDNVSEIGPQGVLGGLASGTVTLYGSPSTMLSGTIYVYAKAVTTRTYRLADGTSVTTKERTGGYRSGAFTFSLEVDDTVSNKRTGITCPVPRVLVYLKERDLGDPV